MKKTIKSSTRSSPSLAKNLPKSKSPQSIKSKKDLKSTKSFKQIKSIKDIKKCELKKSEIIKPLNGSYESKRQLLRNYLINKDDNCYNLKKKSTKEQLIELIKNDNNGFMVIERFLFVFGLLYFVFSIVAFIFYSNKQALFLVGLPSTLHIFRLYLLELNKNLIKLNSSLINVFINSIWLLSIITIIILFLIKDNKEASKIEFQNEIILHVGLFFYTPTVILSLINSIVLYLKKIDFLELYHELNKPDECN